MGRRRLGARLLVVCTLTSMPGQYACRSSEDSPSSEQAEATADAPTSAPAEESARREEATSIPPPDLATAEADDVVRFLGEPSAFPSLSWREREEFLLAIRQRYVAGEDRNEFSDALARMSDPERRVFLESASEITHRRAMEKARAYNRIAETASPRERTEFIDNAIRSFERMRRPLRANPAAATEPARGGPLFGPGSLFASAMPRGSAGMMRIVVHKTTAAERAKMKPFADAIAARYRELRDSGELDRLLARATQPASAPAASRDCQTRDPHAEAPPASSPSP